MKKKKINLESEQLFKTLVQEGSDLIAVLDEEGTYLYVAPTSTKVLGISPEKFIGKNAFDFIHPEDADRVRTAMQNLGDFSSLKIEPFRFQNHKNEYRWIETVFTNMLNNPAVNGIVANSRDITSTVEKDQKSKLLQSVVTNTNDAVIITEADPMDEPGPKIIYVNQAFSTLTGYTADEVIGKSPRILQGPNSDHRALAELGNKLRNGESAEITTINYKKSGEEFWINFSVTPVFDDKNLCTHFIAIERDVTEQKNRELETKLLTELSADFNLENDYEKAVREMCKSIGLYGKFDWVELWTKNLEETKMQLTSYYISDGNIKSLYKENNIKFFQKGIGLIGQVWQKEKQLHLKNVLESSVFIRKDMVSSINLNSVYGIPLIFNQKVLGVLAIGTKKEAKYLKKYHQLFKRLEEFLGSEIQRKLVESDLSHLLNSIPDIVGIGDFQGNILEINSTACELLGYTEEEIVHHNFKKFCHPGDLDKVSRKFKLLKTGHTTLAFEIRVVTKGGEIIWLSWYCQANLNDGLIYSTAKNITEEKKLRELNRQARQLAKIGSWEVDMLKQTVYWSEEVHKMHETDPKTFSPSLETGINFYREDFREMVWEGIERLIQTGEPSDFEAVIVTAKKKEVWVRGIGNAEFVDGKCVRLYGSFQDIQDHKEFELRLQSIGNDLPGVIFQYCINPNGTANFKSVSKGAKQILGFTANEIERNSHLIWDQIRAGGDLKILHNSIEESIKTNSKWSAQWRYLMPNGEMKIHLGYGSPTCFTDGTVIFNSVLLDITEKVKNEELLEQVSKMAKFGSWEVNFTENSVHLSSITRSILEAQSTSVIPDLESFINLFRADFREMVGSRLQKCIQTGKSADFEAAIVSLENNEKWVHVTANSDMLDDHSSRIYGSIQDITVQKKYEIQLEELNRKLRKHAVELERSNQELEQFAFVASHDLQEPLRMISGFMNQLKRKYEKQLDEKAHQYIYFATDGATRMKQIIMDLLEYSRAGRPTEAIEQVDLNELVSEYKLLRRKIISKKAAVISAKDLPTIPTYKAVITQVLHSLLDNALKYSKEGIAPNIEIKVKENPSNWEFSIKDNGIGIDPEFFNKIFIIFQRLHTRDKYEGTGIGLSVAKRHVESLGGEIWVESAVGVGTTFFFTITKQLSTL
ncbi:PAS domain S-box protein [Salinimicrobium sp. CAU 1759]